MNNLYQDRVLSGIVKTGHISSLEEAERLLARDIEVIVDPGRAGENDLWPCIWALCSCLERQFSGTIHVWCGHDIPLVSPVALGSRCSFGTRAKISPLRIFLGQQPNQSDAIVGDARGTEVSYGELLDGPSPANPISCFALAGYLGFAALGVAAGLPPHHAVYRENRLNMINKSGAKLPQEITIVGLGQLGQAYLALLFFMAASVGECPSLVLIDKDRFESLNRRTQTLLSEDEVWLGEYKAVHLEGLVKAWHWKVRGEVDELKWGWKRQPDYPALALLGLDDLEVRRMAIAGGFDWIVDAGLGTSLARPRVSWYQLPPDNKLAATIFKSNRRDDSSSHLVGSELHRQLLDTPGGCGWVMFENIKAAAPSMGLAAAAYAIAEILSERQAVSGGAYLWSPMLPFSRERLTPEEPSKAARP